MIPEIGHFSLILALCLALVLSVVPLIGAAKGWDRWISLARPLCQGQFVFLLIAILCLGYAFYDNDFSVLYVASHSNSLLPWFYRIAALWGGHEGSMMLWVFFLGMWAVAVAFFSRDLPNEMVARVLSVMGVIIVGFILFMLFTSNPFERLLPPAIDGRDLNPLLQDPGLIFHPPLLYMGYVGFSVAFSFAIAALLGGHLDAAWARWSRPWTTIAWVFLTLGIALGSWWAYYELGWGGWWFWDPVENASFLPWLVGTALIHSLAVTEKRGSFKNWTVLLAIITFSLSLLGTFLVRSGVLTSVHAFATDPERGVFILGFLIFVIGVSLTLYAWRAPKVGMGGGFALISRESLLLGNNVLLVVAAAAVLLGTLYPLFLDSLGMGKISVGPPYFDNVFFPLMVPVIFLMGVGPYARWKNASLPSMFSQLKWALGISIAGGIAMPLIMGEWSTMASIGFLMGFWSISTVALHIWGRVEDAKKRSTPARMTRSYMGMNLAHFGIGVFIIGVVMVNTYQSDEEVRMDIGDTVEVGGYLFRFDGVTQIQGPNYTALRGLMTVTQNGKPVTVLHPEKRNYTVQTMPMTEAGIDSGLFRDLYVSLGEPVSGGAWSVRVYHKPFIGWIWLGCILMSLGGLLAISDRRYRLSAKRKLGLAKQQGVASANQPAKEVNS